MCSKNIVFKLPKTVWNNDYIIHLNGSLCITIQDE